MKIKLLLSICTLIVLGAAGCVPVPGGSASQKANATADKNMYQAITYANAHKKGPVLVVLPGKIKSTNATFTQKIDANNIADYAELELGQANFRVLERSDLGVMLNELSLAANMGDTAALARFKKGKFKTTRWFVRFDILKAEKVAEVNQGFSGDTAGDLLSTLLGGTAGSVTNTVASSVKTDDAAGVWITGLRYKVLDAATSEQVATGYYEDKMEIGKQGVSILGVSQSQQNVITLDSMVQRLVQRAVADLDSKK